MALMQLHFYSQALEMQTEINVLLPEPSQGIGVEGTSDSLTDLPVLYLLHGLSDDQTIWARRTSLERYVSTCRLAVVMPCAHQSFYSNEKYGLRYWDYVSRELPEVVRKFLPVSSRREDTFAAGLSMGGYGALKLALRCPDRFAAAASLSGVVDLVSAFRAPAHFHGLPRIFGDVAQLQDSPDDLYAAARHTACLEDKPKLYVACGTEDPFFYMHQPFCSTLTGLGYDVTALSTPDIGHEWAYWDAQLPQILQWLREKCHAKI